MPEPNYFSVVVPLGHSGSPLDPLAWEVFETFAKSLGLTEFGQVSYFAVVQAWRAGTTPPPTAPPLTDPTPIPAILFRLKVLATVLNVRTLPVSGAVVRTVAKDSILEVFKVDEATGWNKISQTSEEWVTARTDLVQKMG